MVEQKGEDCDALCGSGTAPLILRPTSQREQLRGTGLSISEAMNLA